VGLCLGPYGAPWGRAFSYERDAIVFPEITPAGGVLRKLAGEPSPHHEWFPMRMLDSVGGTCRQGVNARACIQGHLAHKKQQSPKTLQ